jgi:hypothetical protein
MRKYLPYLAGAVLLAILAIAATAFIAVPSANAEGVHIDLEPTYHLLSSGGYNGFYVYEFTNKAGQACTVVAPSRSGVDSGPSITCAKP